MEEALLVPFKLKIAGNGLKLLILFAGFSMYKGSHMHMMVANTKFSNQNPNIQATSKQVGSHPKS
jgi:hypothetical protein